MIKKSASPPPASLSQIGRSLMVVGIVVEEFW
jgi:hypothetical protein